MPDLLCPLLSLPAIGPHMQRINAHDIHLRRANPWELTALRTFIAGNFSEAWADETSVAMARQPVSCFVATHENKIIGFADYECTRRGYFGPTGVLESYRGKGVGTALLLAALVGLRDMGYTYAVIGGAGPVDFYRKTVGAIVIPFDEGRGPYHLKDDPAFASS